MAGNRKRKIQQENNLKNKKAKEVRVWVDGCFDMIHYGHADALRQAKQMADRVVVGVYHDEEIVEHKGPPVFNIDERCKILEGIKWVDEVVKGVPFVTTVETVDDNNCDFAAHGDDYTTTVDGKDSFYDVKVVGRFKEYKRVLDISTTDLIGRMLSATKIHHQSDSETHLQRNEVEQFCQNSTENNLYIGTSEYVTSSRKIKQFSEGRDPKETDKIIYVAGAFDLFHIGHLEFLMKAAAEGDYLIVGIHSDSVVNKYHGSNYPIASLHERVLQVLANKYVSEVLIGAPMEVTAHILDHYNISVVCHGKTSVPPSIDRSDPYAEPKRRGIFKLIDSGSAVTTETIVNRIRQNRSVYETRNEKKLAREAKFLPTNVPVCNNK